MLGHRMTPKEKAIELVEKIGKEYALIAVDEILSIYLSRHVELYWQEVRQEIEKS